MCISEFVKLHDPKGTWLTLTRADILIIIANKEGGVSLVFVSLNSLKNDDM